MTDAGTPWEGPWSGRGLWSTSSSHYWKGDKMEQSCDNCLYKDDCKLIIFFDHCGYDFWEPNNDYIYPGQEVVNSG